MKGDGPQTKVHYKGADDDFIVFIAGTEILKKWKEDKSIPLVEVVQSFEVFVTSKCASKGHSLWKASFWARLPAAVHAAH